MTVIASPHLPQPHIGQEHSHDAQQREPGADVENEFNARPIGKPAEERGADAAQPEHQAEEHPGNHAHLVRHQVGGIHHDGGESRSDDQSRNDRRHDGPPQAEVRHRQRERRRTQDGEQDDILPPVAVAQETAQQRARRKSRQVGEQAILRHLHRHAELLHQVEREVTRHAGIEKVFRENHQHQDAQSQAHRPAGQAARGERLAEVPVLNLGQHQAVPIAHTRQQHRRQQGRQRKPPHRMLPVGDDHQRRQQGSERTPPVAPDLENGLRQALFPARSQLRHPRRLRVEDRRAAPYQRHRHQQHQEIGRKGQRHQSHQRETHPHSQRVRLRMAVGIPPHERLEHGRRQLENQRDDADLREGEPELLFQQRINGGNDRLYHVVQQVADAHGEQDGIGRALRYLRVPLKDGWYVHNVLFLRQAAPAAQSARAKSLPPQRYKMPGT